MLNLTPHVCHSPNVTKTLLPFHKPFFHGFAFLSVNSRPSSSCRKTTKSFKASRFGSLKVNAALSSSVTSADYVKASTSTVKAVVTVQQTDCFGFLTNLAFEGPIVDIVKRGIVDIVDRAKDDIADLMGKSIFLELVSADLNPKETGHEKEKIKGYAHRVKQQGNNVIYEAEFTVGGGFGEIGAVVVENEHHKEMFLVNIKLSGFSNNGPITVKCNSWVHSKFDNHQKRVFFTDKSYLPSQTPSGLNRWRKDELKNLRGNGTGERETFERIYDYDVYNDIGDPDSDLRKKRPVLGGNKQFPYPRRCRTGRPQCHSDPLSEKKSNLFYYVPRDEAFSEVKQLTFYAHTLSSVFHALIPNLEVHGDPDRGFPSFKAIDQLFDEGIDLPLEAQLNFWKTLFPRLLKLNWRTVVSSVLDYIQDESRNVLSFERPETMKRDKFFWLKDEEFARQTLAGMNPCTIQLITEWPLKSKLDPKIYGHAESAITKEMIETEIKGLMTFEEALKQKKLFIIDYHDLLLPYVEKVRGIDGTTLYGSRTIFFLNPDETLKPLAIELTCPPINGKPQWKHVYQPAWNASGVWLWELAKAHFLAHDSGVHQLVSHWLRTHCCTEPYIIATNRQLSAMHPIYRLLHPHFRYTMKINALARETLINAEGIIETSFSPGKYSMELSSVAYGLQWRFDQQALPADLISRGMAVEDPSAPYGLRLTIGDYPYANDGLIIWDIIKQWVSDYVNHYYPNGSFVESDQELQTWWTEIRTVGHADKKDEPGWPDLKTPEDLINIITIIAWVASGHHAAVNFGQYTYAGYFPNRPTIARKNMPTEEATEWELFMNKPEDLLLLYFPSQIQATKVMGVLDVLSEHSPDEEYLGENSESAWDENPVIKAAFEKFSGRLKELEGIVDERNANPDLKNRNGAGIVPYEFLKPFSESGLTGKGVPYSISI